MQYFPIFVKKLIIVLLVFLLVAACVPAGQPASAPVTANAGQSAVADATNGEPIMPEIPLTFMGMQPERCDPRDPVLTSLESEPIELGSSVAFPGATVAIVEYTNEDGHRFRLEALSFAPDAGRNYLQAAQVCFEAMQATGEERFASIPLYTLLYNALVETTPLYSFSELRRQWTTFMADHGDQIPTLENLLQQSGVHVRGFYDVALDRAEMKIAEAYNNELLTREEADVLRRKAQITYNEAIFVEDALATFEEIAAIPTGVILVYTLSDMLGLSIADLTNKFTEYRDIYGARPSIADLLRWLQETQGLTFDPVVVLSTAQDVVQREIGENNIIPTHLLEETVKLYAVLYESPTAFELLLGAAADPRLTAQLASKQKIGFDEFLEWLALWDAQGTLPSLAEDPITDGFPHLLYADPNNLAISIEWVEPLRTERDNYVVFFVLDPSIVGPRQHYYNWRLLTSVITGVKVTGNKVDQRLAYTTYSQTSNSCAYRGTYISNYNTTQQESAQEIANGGDGVVHWLSGGPEKKYYGTQVTGLVQGQQNEYSIFGSWRDNSTKWECLQ